MPHPRPLENLGISELQDLAFTYWTSQGKLKEIEHELSLRAVPTAMDLCDEIRNRLATFFDEEFAEQHRGDEPPRTAPVDASHDPFWAQARHQLSLSQARARAAVAKL